MNAQQIIDAAAEKIFGASAKIYTHAVVSTDKRGYNKRTGLAFSLAEAEEMLGKLEAIGRKATIVARPQ